MPMPGSPHPYKDGIPPPRMTESPEQEEAEDDGIPPLTHIAPSIFVPATFDFTKPPEEPPRDADARLRQAEIDLDKNSREVKNNIFWMVTREITRIQRDCAKAETQYKARHGKPPPLSRKGPSTPDEVALIKSMMAAPRPEVGATEVGFDFSARDIVPGATDPSRETPRETAEKQLLNLVQYFAMQIENYENFLHGVNGVKQRRGESIRKEVAEEIAHSLALNLTNSNEKENERRGSSNNGVATDIDY